MMITTRKGGGQNWLVLSEEHLLRTIPFCLKSHWYQLILLATLLPQITLVSADITG